MEAPHSVRSVRLLENVTAQQCRGDPGRVRPTRSSGATVLPVRRAVFTADSLCDSVPQGRSQGGGHRGQSLPLRPVGPSGEETTKRYPVVCTPEAYHGKIISSLKRSRLRISNASDAATNLRGPLGLRRLNLEAVGPSCGLLTPPTGL